MVCIPTKSYACTISLQDGYTKRDIICEFPGRPEKSVEWWEDPENPLDIDMIKEARHGFPRLERSRAHQRWLEDTPLCIASMGQSVNCYPMRQVLAVKGDLGDAPFDLVDEDGDVLIGPNTWCAHTIRTLQSFSLLSFCFG